MNFVGKPLHDVTCDVIGETTPMQSVYTFSSYDRALPVKDSLYVLKNMCRR